LWQELLKNISRVSLLRDKLLHNTDSPGYSNYIRYWHFANTIIMSVATQPHLHFMCCI